MNIAQDTIYRRAVEARILQHVFHGMLRLESKRLETAITSLDVVKLSRIPGIMYTYTSCRAAVPYAERRGQAFTQQPKFVITMRRCFSSSRQGPPFIVVCDRLHHHNSTQSKANGCSAIVLSIKPDAQKRDRIRRKVDTEDSLWWYICCRAYRAALLFTVSRLLIVVPRYLPQ